jgi:hypothetical protein
MSSHEILHNIIKITAKKIPYISLRAGVSHQTLYRLHSGKSVSMRTKFKLIRFLNMINQTNN